MNDEWMFGRMVGGWMVDRWMVDGWMDERINE
jgi:hypothetical protein